MDMTALTSFAAPFSAIVTSIVLEAAPFLLLGSLLSSILAVFVGDGALERLGRRPVAVQIALGCLAGVILPTCECGVVPVVRRLLKKGVPAATAIPFLLAAPVVNPVSVASTVVAFQGDWTMAALRVGLALVPAAALGWALASTNGLELLRPTLDMAPGHDHGHDHGPDCGCGCGHDHSQQAPGSLPAKILDVLRHTAQEFLDMGRYLILGACAAGLFKTLLPQGLLALVSGSLLPAIAAMMLLAVLLSVCSEADAFVAASLSMFPPAALLSFLVLGPMLDLKLIPAFLSVFKRRVALAVICVPALMIFILSAALGLTGVLP